MPTKIEKDSVTGRMTTGHEWDGLKELNTPLPKWWVWTWGVTIVWAIIWAILYPSFPGITGYYHGVLGYSQHKVVDQQVAAIRRKRAVFMDKIATTPIAAVDANPELRVMALHAGALTFAENCQPCHGPAGIGQPGYPALNTDVWRWGGTLAQIEQTITHGIRSGDPAAHNSQMPRFGADSILTPAQIGAVADYVVTLFGQKNNAADLPQGRTVFAQNCAACHGAKGQGNIMMGAPPLRSHVHLFASTRAQVVAQVTDPRHGVMPNWSPRLDTATIRSVAIYVHSLGGGR